MKRPLHSLAMKWPHTISWVVLIAAIMFTYVRVSRGEDRDHEVCIERQRRSEEIRTIILNLAAQTIPNSSELRVFELDYDRVLPRIEC